MKKLTNEVLVLSNTPYRRNRQNTFSSHGLLNSLEEICSFFRDRFYVEVDDYNKNEYVRWVSNDSIVPTEILLDLYEGELISYDSIFTSTKKKREEDVTMFNELFNQGV